MKKFIILSVLVSMSVFAFPDDPCREIDSQRKCETDGRSLGCIWLKAKEICKNKEILDKEIEEQQKGLQATEDEVDIPIINKNKREKK